MKKFLVFALLLYSASVSAMSEVDDLAEDLSRDYVKKAGQVLIKKRIAVLDFENVTPLMKKHEIGTTVSSLMIEEISNSTVFRIVERKNLDKIMKEAELSMTGMVNQDQAVKAGELSGAELLLVGSVSETGRKISISARIISAETGEVLAAKTVQVQLDAMIKTADEVYWSAFQSEYGISFSLGSNMIFPNSSRMSPALDINVGYKPWRHFRVGGGFIYGTLTEFRSDEYRLNSTAEGGTAQTGVDTTDWGLLSGSHNIQHNYHVNLGLIKFFADGLMPVTRWFTLGVRFEYWISLGNMTNIEQEIHGFPVPVSFDADGSTTYDSPEFVEQRIVVNAAPAFVQMYKPALIAEFLISKRVSFNVSIGYLIAQTIKPEVFYTADDYRQAGNADVNGVFPRYPYYNFARDQHDKLISADISGFNISTAISFHI